MHSFHQSGLGHTPPALDWFFCSW